jgi:hypothetical protein
VVSRSVPNSVAWLEYRQFVLNKMQAAPTQPALLDQWDSRIECESIAFWVVSSKEAQFESSKSMMKSGDVPLP